MKNDKETKRNLILKSSYKLLLHRSYKDVTFSDIENETRLTRGAIYYYFDNKRHLFEEIIRSFYFIHFYNYNLSCLISEGFTIESFRNSYKCPFQRIVIHLQKLSEQFNITNPARSFCHLTIQASVILPKFDEEVKILLSKESETVKNLIMMLSDSTFESDEVSNMLTEIYDSDYLKIFKTAFLL